MRQEIIADDIHHVAQAALVTDDGQGAVAMTILQVVVNHTAASVMRHELLLPIHKALQTLRRCHARKNKRTTSTAASTSAAASKPLFLGVSSSRPWRKEEKEEEFARL
jgi:heme exporter protein D